MFAKPSFLPDLSKMDCGDRYSHDILIEYRQSEDEGLDISPYKTMFETVAAMPEGQLKESFAGLLFQLVCQLGQRADYAYQEPSEYRKIRELCRPVSVPSVIPDKSKMRDKVTGAWYGRICGCLLGKPIEGIRTDELQPFLRATGNEPLHRYITATDADNPVCRHFSYKINQNAVADRISCAPADDDTNYTVLAQLLVEKYGRDFLPEHVLNQWIDAQPKTAYFTAEKVAYLNGLRGLYPPKSAMYQNPYREWIGAQIRADYYGYINPGNPESAAEMAYRDASVSHVKNGIYGAMLVSAMLSAAAVADDIQNIIAAGLGQIPATSRLYQVLSDAVQAYRHGVSQEEAFRAVHRQYDEHSPYDWCHVIPNALIVILSLLYGGGDYGKSICLAVQTGFDTDCNGATVGSVVGMWKGLGAVGSTWRQPVDGKLTTQLVQQGCLSVEELAEKTLAEIF